MMMDSALDADVLAARGGDRTAFARLVTRTRNLVTAISLATVRDVGTSEEIAQEVFLAVWRDLGSLRSPSSFLPWLRQVTRHQSLNALRSGRRRGGAVDLSHVDVLDPGPTAQESLLGDERARVLAESLDAIPDEAREVITLYYREGQSVDQVAQLLGLRPETARKRLSRAREALREEVLARFAESVETSEPGEELTSAVLMAIPLAGAPAATVATKGILLALGKASSAVASGASGAFGGLLGVVVGIRKELARAADDRERRELMTLGVVAGVNVVLFGAGIPFVKPLSPEHYRALGTAWIVAFTAVHMAIYALWLPRVKARRLALERDGDPAAKERQAREARRAHGWCAVVVGIVGVIIALLWAR